MDGPLSAPLEQKHARGATAPDKWRPERGYCRRPPATTPPRTHRTTPYPSIRTVEPPPTPLLADRGPGPWLKRGGRGRGRNEIDRRIFRGARPSALDKLSIGSAEQHDCGPLSWERTLARETPLPRDGFFLSARGKFCVEKKRRVTGEIHRIDVIRSCSFENVVIDY